MGVLCLSSDDTQTLQLCSSVRAPTVVWIILYFTVDSLYWQIDTVEINTAWKEKKYEKKWIGKKRCLEVNSEAATVFYTRSSAYRKSFIIATTFWCSILSLVQYLLSFSRARVDYITDGTIGSIRSILFCSFFIHCLNFVEFDFGFCVWVAFLLLHSLSLFV